MIDPAYGSRVPGGGSQVPGSTFPLCQGTGKVGSGIRDPYVGPGTQDPPPGTFTWDLGCGILYVGPYSRNKYVGPK